MIQTIKKDEINTRIIKELRKSQIFESMSQFKEHNELCQLLDIVYGGNVIDCKSYIEKNNKYIELIDIKNDDLLRKMRLLTLLSIGHKIKLISFEKLKKELLIETLNDIESIVIDAIKRKLIQAKIDHLNEQVIIKLCFILFYFILFFF